MEREDQKQSDFTEFRSDRIAGLGRDNWEEYERKES
jgi:hypothetical protein